MASFISHFHQLQRELALPSAVEQIRPDWQYADSVSVFVKRDDLIHPIISGNKWRKLQPVLNTLKHATPIVSFGGGYSNHLHALGYVCHRLHCPFIAIVRGDYQARETPMLLDLQRWGARIEYVTKQTYRQREEPDYLETLQLRFPGSLIVPEGGSQAEALSGVAGIVTEQPCDFDTIVVPVASGATIAGIAKALPPSKRVLGIGVLKGANYLVEQVTRLGVSEQSNWQILDGFHHGGYAKRTPELERFCDDFELLTHIPIEPVYSGKLFYALKQLVEQQYFAPDSKILAIHTGGLQGNRK